MKRFYLSRIVLLVSIICLVKSYADDGDAPESEDSKKVEINENIEEIVTVGTRRRSHTVSNSAVPIEIYPEEEINSVNSSDLIEVLSTLVPSFSVRRQPISDGASFIRPTQVRNLEPHHSLVLIRNKRRHRSAFMWLGGYGAHGADIGSIPSVTIESVELLRDGAAAQYGSDAIAGVIYFKLRDADSGASLRARYGGYEAGDGTEFTLEGNFGAPIYTDGFVNVSAQFSDSEPTSRSDHYDISIVGSGLLPYQAVTNQLVVDGVTYYGPDAFTYEYSDTGEIIQVLPGRDGIPDDLDTRYADIFSKSEVIETSSNPLKFWGNPIVVRL